jgi:hypothetical protein
MKTKHPTAEDIDQAYKSLQVEHKSLLEKNQNDLVRIRQSEAHLKVQHVPTEKVLTEIEKERGEWVAKDRNYQDQIEQLTKKLQLLIDSKDTFTKQQET